MTDHSSETNVMEIDWDLEHFMSQVDLDDAEDFKLTDILKEFRFLPPVDNEKERVPKSTRKATHVSPLSSDSTEQCNIAAKLSLDTPVSISFVKGDMRFELRFRNTCMTMILISKIRFDVRVYISFNSNCYIHEYLDILNCIGQQVADSSFFIG